MLESRERTVTTWPNWVDLIIVSIFLRACYNGFSRGLVSEILGLVGAVGVTCLSVNYWYTVKGWLEPWLWVRPHLAGAMVFALVFLAALLLLRLALERISTILKWERLHWGIQGLGLLLGALRGLWWAGLVLVLLTSSGVAYLQASVMEKSVLGPRLAEQAEDHLARIAARFPGAAQRGPDLLPAVK